MAADLNVVRLYGQIVEKPRMYLDKPNGEPVSADFLLRTLTRYHNSFNPTEERFDVVTVYTANQPMIEKIRTMRVNDIILLKGMLCTKDVIRNKGRCPVCGHPIKAQGLTAYVYPIHIMVIDEMRSEEDGIVLMRNNNEFSNECYVSGEVISEVEYNEATVDKETYRKIPEAAKYSIKVKRPFRIAEDSEQRNVDFPIVFSYFEQAKTDSISLLPGSTLNIHGSVRARQVSNDIICPHCKTVLESEDSIACIVASYIGYTHNFNEPPKQEEVKKNIELL